MQPQGLELAGLFMGALPALVLCAVALLLAGRKLSAHPKARSYLRIGLALLILRELCMAATRLFVMSGTGLSGPAAVTFAGKLAAFNLVIFVTWLGGMVLLLMA